MENKFKQTGLTIFISFLLFSCDQFEMRGFVAAYESADQRFQQSMEWNRRNPYQEIVTVKDDYSLYCTADSHVGDTKKLDIFLRNALESEAKALVMVGDITTGNAEDIDNFKLWLPAREIIPAFLVAGNHDLYFDGWKKFYSLFGSSTYIFFVRTPVFTDMYICLDTGSGTMGSEQIDWLRNVLETERLNYRNCVLFTHNNLFRIRHTVTGNPFVEELQVLLEMCVKYNINMIVSGHDHKKNVTSIGNTTFITMDHLQDNRKNSGYLKLLIKGGKIHFEFVQI